MLQKPALDRILLLVACRDRPIILFLSKVLGLVTLKELNTETRVCRTIFGTIMFIYTVHEYCSYKEGAIKDGLKEKGHFFLLSNFFSLLLILKEEHVYDQKMV